MNELMKYYDNSNIIKCIIFIIKRNFLKIKLFLFIIFKAVLRITLEYINPKIKLNLLNVDELTFNVLC